MGEIEDDTSTQAPPRDAVDTVEHADRAAEMERSNTFIADLAARLAAQPRSQRDWRRD